MRIGFGLVAGSLVLAWAVALSSAIPPQGQVATSPPSTTAPPGTDNIRWHPPTAGLTPPRVSTPPSTVAPLSSSDCTDLGGTVVDDWVGVCASKKVCTRTDNYGQTHSVCLSVSG